MRVLRGAKFIEGCVYRPATLKDATRDRHAGRMDAKTHLARIAERRAFELHAKERAAVEQADIPEFLDRICQQHSVSFTKEDTMRQKQALSFMSQEWDEFHDHARQSIESLHAGFKDDGKEGVKSSARRRARGFVAGQILVTIMLINFNLRATAKFLRDESGA